MWGLIHAAFHEPRTRAYRITEGVIWVFVTASVALIAAEPFLPEWALAPLAVVDTAILGVFAVELILRVLSFRPADLDTFRRPPLGALRVHVTGRLKFLLQPLVLVDLITVLAVVPALRGLRVLRLLRLLRTSRRFRYGNPFRDLTLAFGRDRLLFQFAFLILATETVLGGISLFLVERSATQAMLEAGADSTGFISSPGEGVWWALVTLTTVGYGDYTPHTELGRVIGAVLMVGGMFTLALFAGIVGHSLLNAVLSIRGEKIRMTGYLNHIIVCGYEAGSSLLLWAMADELDLERNPVVLIGPGERPADVPAELLWVSGDPSKERELDKVRATHARSVILMGSRSAPPTHADASTILTAFTLRSYLAKNETTKLRRRPVHIIAEILDPENVQHARAAGVDEIIESRRLGFEIISHAVAFPGVGEATSRVVASGAQSFYVGLVPKEIEIDAPARFGAVAAALRTHHSILVVGLRDPSSGEQRLNPPDDDIVGEDHIVYLAERPVLEVPA